MLWARWGAADQKRQMWVLKHPAHPFYLLIFPFLFFPLVLTHLQGLQVDQRELLWGALSRNLPCGHGSHIFVRR